MNKKCVRADEKKYSAAYREKIHHNRLNDRNSGKDQECWAYIQGDQNSECSALKTASGH